MPIIEDILEVDGEKVTILVEVDKIPAPESIYGEMRGDKAEKVLAEVKDLFGDGLELARTCAARAVDSIRAMESKVRPNEFEIELAIKLDAEVGAVLAKAGAEAQMQVTMKWIRDELED